MHYAKAPAIDSTYRINGGVTFDVLRRRKRERRRKAIEAYVNKQSASQPEPTTSAPKPSLLQRIKNFFS